MKVVLDTNVFISADIKTACHMRSFYILRTSSEETAIRCTAHMTQCRVVDLDTVLALESAELSIRNSLAMADAIVYATSRKYSAEIITSDADLKGLEGVTFFQI